MNVKYAVIIVNYNTIEDAINAAESVKRNATTESYIICIADNCSSKELDRKNCKEYKTEHVITFCLESNTGYAKGNNEAIRFLKKHYKAMYYVIMNPDVLVLKKGTIEGMIQKIEKHSNDIIGGQPLVWNCNYSKQANMQQNIRSVPDYKDICMLSFLPLKLLLNKRYKKLIYANDRPYNREIRYRVPSGAFFLIRAEVFEKINFFDENTFLYFEEYILGKKIEMIDQNFLFMPQFIVKHEHGKSTGNNHYTFNRYAQRCAINSRLYYAKEYLKCSRRQLIYIKILSEIDIIFQYIRFSINKILHK